jgi:hypothetical protein
LFLLQGWAGRYATENQANRYPRDGFTATAYKGLQSAPSHRPNFAPFWKRTGDKYASSHFAVEGLPIAQFQNQVREAASVSGLFHRKELRQPTVRCRRWHFSDMARWLAQVRNSHARRNTGLWFVSHRRQR